MCPGCHNEELWNFNEGSEFRGYLKKIQKRINTGLVDSVWILGGDPMDQDRNSLIELINFIKKNKEIQIWLWTRYSIHEIPDEILDLLDFLKTGEFKNDGSNYIDQFTGIELASSNQKIISLEKKTRN